MSRFHTAILLSGLLISAGATPATASDADAPAGREVEKAKDLARRAYLLELVNTLDRYGGFKLVGGTVAGEIAARHGRNRADVLRDLRRVARFERHSLSPPQRATADEAPPAPAVTPALPESPTTEEQSASPPPAAQPPAKAPLVEEPPPPQSYLATLESTLDTHGGFRSVGSAVAGKVAAQYGRDLADVLRDLRRVSRGERDSLTLPRRAVTPRSPEAPAGSRDIRTAASTLEDKLRASGQRGASTQTRYRRKLSNLISRYGEVGKIPSTNLRILTVQWNKSWAEVLADLEHAAAADSTAPGAPEAAADAGPESPATPAASEEVDEPTPSVIRREPTRRVVRKPTVTRTTSSRRVAPKVAQDSEFRAAPDPKELGIYRTALEGTLANHNTYLEVSPEVIARIAERYMRTQTDVVRDLRRVQQGQFQDLTNRRLTQQELDDLRLQQREDEVRRINVPSTAWTEDPELDHNYERELEEVIAKYGDPANVPLDSLEWIATKWNRLVSRVRVELRRVNRPRSDIISQEAYSY
jgi:hypothetical protein